MKQIKLTKNQVALVDDEDFEFLNQFKWYALKGAKTYYAIRFTTSNQSAVLIYMHRIILKARKGQLVDHINENGLCNQKTNLRFCTPSQNLCNRGKTSANKTGYKGVSWNIEKQKYAAQIWHKNKRYHLGYHDDVKEAGLAYNKKAIELHGEFANINIIEKVNNG